MKPNRSKKRQEMLLAEQQSQQEMLLLEHKALDRSPLGKLSPELREMIFKLAMTVDGGVVLSIVPDENGKFHNERTKTGWGDSVDIYCREEASRLDILRTCRLIRREASHFFFSENEFHLARRDMKIRDFLQWLQTTKGAISIERLTFCTPTDKDFEPEGSICLSSPSSHGEWVWKLEQRLPRLRGAIQMSLARPRMADHLHPITTTTEEERRLVQPFLTFLDLPFVFSRTDHEAAHGTIGLALGMANERFDKIKATNILPFRTLCKLSCKKFSYTARGETARRELHTFLSRRCSCGPCSSARS